MSSASRSGFVQWQPVRQNEVRNRTLNRRICFAYPLLRKLTQKRPKSNYCFLQNRNSFLKLAHGTQLLAEMQIYGYVLFGFFTYALRQRLSTKILFFFHIEITSFVC